jgi:hypothetical protein
MSKKANILAADTLESGISPKSMYQDVRRSCGTNLNLVEKSRHVKNNTVTFEQWQQFGESQITQNSKMNEFRVERNPNRKYTQKITKKLVIDANNSQKIKPKATLLPNQENYD